MIEMMILETMDILWLRHNIMASLQENTMSSYTFLGEGMTPVVLTSEK